MIRASDPAAVITDLSGLKQDVDFLLLQLSEGHYSSVDIFANNWIHLTRLYEQVQARINDRVVMDFLVRTDLVLAADLMAVGRMITVMNNFLRCVGSIH